MKVIDNRTIIIGPARLSYLHVFKPHENSMKGKIEFSVVLMIPKTPNEKAPDCQADLKGIADVVKGVANAKFGEAVKAYERPLKDGDKETNSEGEPKYPGYWYMTAWCPTEWPPVLIDGNRTPVTDGWNSGDWGVVKINFFAYDHKGKKGVSGGLKAIQFTHKDEPFGNITDPAAVANEFDVVEGADVPDTTPSDAYNPFEDN